METPLFAASVIFVPLDNLLQISDIRQSQLRSILDALLLEGALDHCPVSCDAFGLWNIFR
jgi:hypothetical protein